MLRILVFSLVFGPATAVRESVWAPDRTYFCKVLHTLRRCWTEEVQRREEKGWAGWVEEA